MDIHVAIKRVSKSSLQGRKEYISEVNIISRLRHRNLVMLIGWRHGGGEFLLVYEFMPNGSLDTHIHITRITSCRGRPCNSQLHTSSALFNTFISNSATVSVASVLRIIYSFFSLIDSVLLPGMRIGSALLYLHQEWEQCAFCTVTSSQVIISCSMHLSTPNLVTLASPGSQIMIGNRTQQRLLEPWDTWIQSAC